MESFLELYFGVVLGVRWVVEQWRWKAVGASWDQEEVGESPSGPLEMPAGLPE